MKKTLSILLIITIISALFAACGTQKVTEYPDNHTIYFKDSSKSQKAVATFFNSGSGKSEDVEMKRISEDKNSVTFSCEGNCAMYNMAYITCGSEKTKSFAFNPCVSGWYKTKDDFLPYTEGEEINYTPKYEKLTLTGHGCDKDIYIIKPEDYDASSPQKYSTVYVLDGQFLTYLGLNGQVMQDCTLAADQIKVMNAVTEQKAIVVAIDNSGARDYELVPAFGDSVFKKDFESKNTTPYEDEYDCMNGTEFADFVAETLVPYVRKNYNVYTDTLHTSIVGASLGGVESFYITMEYPDIFGTGGVLSPAFYVYGSEDWNKYLKEKDFDKNHSFLYLYTGSAEYDTGTDTKQMYDRLKDLAYPGDKLLLHYNEDGAHGGGYWKMFFSEYLTAMTYQKVKPLQEEAN